MSANREQTAYDLALRYLKPKERAPRQVCQYLSSKGFPILIVEQVVDLLTQEGWLSQIRFASEYARKWFKKGYSSQWIALALEALSLESAVIEQALSEKPKDYRNLVAQMITGYRRKRFPQLSLETFKPLGMRLLFQRGFQTIIECEEIWALIG